MGCVCHPDKCLDTRTVKLGLYLLALAKLRINECRYWYANRHGSKVEASARVQTTRSHAN